MSDEARHEHERGRDLRMAWGNSPSASAADAARLRGTLSRVACPDDLNQGSGAALWRPPQPEWENCDYRAIIIIPGDAPVLYGIHANERVRDAWRRARAEWAGGYHESDISAQWAEIMLSARMPGVAWATLLSQMALKQEKS